MQIKIKAQFKYDKHTVAEWAQIGYDVTIYDHNDFPLKWEVAIKYGQCLKCGCTDHLRCAGLINGAIKGICHDCYIE
jgi:hypothetical protein